MFSEKSGDRQNLSNKHFIIASGILLVLLISGCSQQAGPCYQQPYADLSSALAYAENDQLPFQFPLDELGIDVDPAPARFCDGSWQEKEEDRKYHAAEDYHLPAGTPVYAFADGEISFSGPMGGYGWLIIIDHPQPDIYSLYGHLSPSRWYLESGTVEKGDLIGYLGDSDENGGSEENPLVTHLHFAIRVGQRVDYTGFGEWRWMAGWIKTCPSDVGWFTPSQVMTGQEIPPGGFPKPEGGLFEKWSVELIMILVYSLGGVLALIYSLKKKNAITPIFYGIVMVIGGIVLSRKGTRINYALYSMALPAFGVVIYQFIQRRKAKPGEGEGESTQ